MRILRHDEKDITQSLMVDVDMTDGKILSVFDATRPFDAAFIQSFINILSQSTTDFVSTEDKILQTKALEIVDKGKIS